MAGVSALPAKILLSKRVQEMVLTDEEPQKPYISRNDGTNEAIPRPPSDLIPIIDLSLLSSSEPCSAQELQRLRSALCSWGCFQVRNFYPSRRLRLEMIAHNTEHTTH
jgi:hypothetical protein